MIVGHAGRIPVRRVHDTWQDISERTPRQRRTRPRVGSVDIKIRVHLPREVGHVGGFEDHRESWDLLLDSEVTLLRIASLIVRRNHVKVARWIVNQRLSVASQDGRQAVLHARGRCRELVNRGGVAGSKRKLAIDPEQRRSIALRVVENSKAPSNYRSPPQLVGKSESRSPIIAIVLNTNLSVRVDAGQQQFSGGEVQRCPLIVHLHRRRRIFVTKTKVERQAGIHLPVVLYVGAYLDSTNSRPHQQEILTDGGRRA